MFNMRSACYFLLINLSYSQLPTNCTITGFNNLVFFLCALKKYSITISVLIAKSDGTVLDSATYP